MAVCFDMWCPECDHREIDVMLKSGEPLPKCPKCQEEGKDTEMRKMMGTHSFELKYDNRKDMCDWQGNTSMYWKDIKEKGGFEPNNPRQPKWE